MCMQHEDPTPVRTETIESQASGNPPEETPTQSAKMIGCV